MSKSRRIDPVLLIGDIVAFLIFAAWGRAEHQTGLSPLAIIGTAAPFIAAWVGVGLWLRTFHPSRVATPLVAVRSVLLPWVLAWPLGLQLRALILSRPIPFIFAVFVLGVNVLLLALWRFLYAIWRRRSSKS